jgi:NAD(P)-dependent dehydrogenase (short-subunit alcohol dehydrogenase family)
MQPEPFGRKSVVLVGASHGVGEALARQYKLQAGRRVVTASRSKFSTRYSISTTVTVDVATGRGLDSLAATVAGQDCLVLITAGIFGQATSVMRSDIEMWTEVLNVNLIGSLRVYRATEISEHSRVVVFSGGGVGGPSHQKEALQYVVSKTALVSMVEEIAGEGNNLLPSLTAVAPGWFNTGFSAVKGASTATDQSPSGVSDEVSLDVGPLMKILAFIETAPREAVNGRLLSANWDTPESISASLASAGDSFGKLRRVDGKSVTVNGGE